MKVSVKRVDPSLPLPQYQTTGSVGFDFVARQQIEVASKEIAIIPSNLIVVTPPGYALMVFSRSSTPRKTGLMLANSVGIIDQDYCGPQDEIGIQVYNFTDEAVVVEKGQRIAQGLFVRVDTLELQEVDQMTGPSRGGFGSTGEKGDTTHE